MPIPPSWLPAEVGEIWVEKAAIFQADGVLGSEGLMATRYREKFAEWMSAIWFHRSGVRFLAGTLPPSSALFMRFEDMDDPRKVFITVQQFGNQARLLGAEFGDSPSANTQIPGAAGKPPDSAEAREEAVIAPFSKKTATVMQGGKA